MLVEIYPREGTETSAVKNFSTFSRVEIYPREGTETLPYAENLLTRAR